MKANEYVVMTTFHWRCLKAGLRQMGLEGIRRAMTKCQEDPENILLDGLVFAKDVTGKVFY